MENVIEEEVTEPLQPVEDKEDEKPKPIKKKTARSSSFFETAGSFANSLVSSAVSVSSNVTKTALKNSTAFVKTAQKHTLEKIQGMQSSHEDPEFLNKVVEMDNFFKFTKKIQLHVRRILSTQQTLTKFNRELFAPLSKIKTESEFRKTLRTVGEAHASGFGDEDKFLTAQHRYERLLTQILTVNLNEFNDAKQEYEVSKINFDIATHNHTSLNSVPGQKLTAAQLKLDQDTDSYQNSKKRIEELYEQYLTTQTNLCEKTVEVEKVRQQCLTAQCKNLGGLFDGTN